MLFVNISDFKIAKRSISKPRKHLVEKQNPMLSVRLDFVIYFSSKLAMISFSDYKPLVRFHVLHK